MSALSPVSLPSEPFKPAELETAPITYMLHTQSPTDTKIQFCYEVLRETLDALQTRRYSSFDPQTTSNCCHGAAVLSLELIQSVQHLNFLELRQQAIEHSKDPVSAQAWQLPIKVMKLAQLYLLTQIRVIDPVKGVRSDYKKIQAHYRVNSVFATQYIKSLQEYYSNSIAEAYSDYLKESTGKINVNNIPVEIWGKYLARRKDKRGISYAPAMYSMEIVLSHLIQNGTVIAILNDIKNTITGKTTRYFRLFKGNHENGFTPVEVKELPDMPIVVFGGDSLTENPENISSEMEKVTQDVPKLILACDIHYPLFPKVQNDPEFDRTPILPIDESIIVELNAARQINGTSLTDRSLYCLNHIFVCNLSELTNSQIPVGGIPTIEVKKN